MSTTNTKAPEPSFLDSAYAEVTGWLSSWFSTPAPAPAEASASDAAHRAALERAAQVAAAYDNEYRAWMHELVEKSISRTLGPVEDSLRQVQQATDRLREELCGKIEPKAKKTAAKKVAARRPTQSEMAARLATAIAGKEELDRILAEMTNAAAERRIAEETRYKEENASSSSQVAPITQVVEVAKARKKAKAKATA